MAFVGSVGIFFFPSLKKRKWICGKVPSSKATLLCKHASARMIWGSSFKTKKKCWKCSFKTFYINHTSETVINQCFLWLQKVVAPHCYANLFVTIIARLSLHNNWIFLLNLTDKEKKKGKIITIILSKVIHLWHKLRKEKRMKINSVYSILTVIWLLILRD